MPKRTDEHKIETESITIIRDLIVDEAIFREQSERDYGIDGVLEFYEKDGVLNGDEISVQIKGSRSVRINKNSINTPSLKTETVKYWFKKRQLVFILVVDVSRKVIYFADVKYFAAQNLAKLENQKTIRFNFSSELNINSKNLSKLRKEVFISNKFERSTSELARLIIDYKEIYTKILCIGGRDCFIMIEDDDPRIEALDEISKSIQLCWYFFRIHTRVHDFNYFKELNYKNWNYKYVELHITETANYLKDQFRYLILMIICLKSQWLEFWKKDNLRVYNILINERDLCLMDRIIKNDIEKFENISR